ncbi:hypothetical protein MKX03_002251 [Papaver bracteatum]|nr:hypothetical protein MKX03_002251 [Papaver bracteatum]
MAVTRSIIIARVFICTLFASNALMCTASLRCSYDPTEISTNTTDIAIKIGKHVIVGICYTAEACPDLCSGQITTVGTTEDKKRGLEL